MFLYMGMQEENHARMLKELVHRNHKIGPLVDRYLQQP